MDPYLAQVVMFGGTFAPRGWLLCNGALLSIAQNTALFSLLGTTYGGNGQTTFALPDFRGRTPVGTGQGPGLPDVILGEPSGLPTTTLISTNIPIHTHTATVAVAVSDTAANSTEADGKILASPVSRIYTTLTNASGNLGGIAPVNSSIIGSGQPFDNRQPYIGILFLICNEGLYPSRN